MADSTGKIDIHFERSGNSKDVKLILRYTFTASSPMTDRPTFGVLQRLDWKDPPADDQRAAVHGSSSKLRIIDDAEVQGTGSRFSFQFELDEDVTEVTVKTWAQPPTSPADEPLRQDVDRIRLDKDFLNRKVARVLRVQDGQVEPNIVEFSATCTDSKGIETPLPSFEGSYVADKPLMQRIIGTGKDDFPPSATFVLRWKVESLQGARIELETQERSEEVPPVGGAPLFAQKKMDVTSITTDGTGSVTWKHPAFDKAKKVPVYPSFCCDLRLKDASGKVLRSRTICGFGKYPKPEFERFEVTAFDGGRVLSPTGGKVRIHAKGKFAQGCSFWVAVSDKAHPENTLELFQLKKHAESDDAAIVRDVPAGLYPTSGSVVFRAAMFQIKDKDRPFKPADAPWDAVNGDQSFFGEGAFHLEAQPQELQMSYVVDAGARVWLDAGGDEANWQWKVFGGKMEQSNAIATGPFDGAKHTVPLSQLLQTPGAMRLGIATGGGAANQGGTYLVSRASSDGKADPAQLLACGELQPWSTEVLRSLAVADGKDIVISLSPAGKKQPGAGFKKIKHWFVLMMENRSYDHMLGLHVDLQDKADGTLNPDGSRREDCFSWDCEVVKKPATPANQLVETRTKVFPSPSSQDSMLIDPGHELSNIHFGLFGWNTNQSTNTTNTPDMHGFIGPYLNRLLPRTVAEGQWDGDALASHNFKRIPSIPWTASLVVPPAWPVAVLSAVTKHDVIQETLEAKGVKIEGLYKAVMEGMTRSQIPALSSLATEYALCDRWFASLPGPTWPNRLFVHCGTSGGLDDSPPPVSSAWRAKLGSYDLGNIYDLVVAAKREWMVYAAGSNAQADTVLIKSKIWDSSPLTFRRVVTGDADFQHLREELPNYEHLVDASGSFTFLEPDYGDLGINADLQNNLAAAFLKGNSQHPISGVKSGDNLIKRVVEILKTRPDVWNHCALVVTYDEHGGFYDHVPPPAAVPPDGEGKYSVPRPAPPDGWTGFWPKLTERFKFARLGVRVPTVIVSPLIPSGVVDHTVYDHTSVLRTVRRSFDISTKLSDREEKANDFSHLFTLETPRPL